MDDPIKANRITVKGHYDTIMYKKKDAQDPFTIRAKMVHQYKDYERSYFIPERVKRRALKRIIDDIPAGVDIEMILIDPVRISVEPEE